MPKESFLNWEVLTGPHCSGQSGGAQINAVEGSQMPASSPGLADSFDALQELHAACRSWTAHIPQNLPYVDLMFAFGFATMGERSRASTLLEAARKVMVVPIPTAWTNSTEFEATAAAATSNFLFKAFKYRIEQALAGKRHIGLMPSELEVDLGEIITKARAGGTNNPYLRAEYVIDQMRAFSRIIEPEERVDRYRYWTKNQDPLTKAFVELHTIREPAELEHRIRTLFMDGIGEKVSPYHRLPILLESLSVASRVGEAFTVELLELVPVALVATPSTENPQSTRNQEPPDLPKKQGELLELALLFAAHYDRRDISTKLLATFVELMRSKTPEQRLQLVNAVATQTLRSLKKLDMNEGIDEFLKTLQGEVLHGATLDELKAKYRGTERWGAVLQALLHLAAGWLALGLADRAEPILNDARYELLDVAAVKLPPKDYTDIARAYVTALGEGPRESGLARITELFRKMNPRKITNIWTTAQYFSRFHLELVEDVVFAICRMGADTPSVVMA
jgi:hypothetical protein